MSEASKMAPSAPASQPINQSDKSTPNEAKPAAIVTPAPAAESGETKKN